MCLYQNNLNLLKRSSINHQHAHVATNPTYIFFKLHQSLMLLLNIFVAGTHIILIKHTVITIIVFVSHRQNIEVICWITEAL